MPKLAILGGSPIRNLKERPYPSYPKITDEEIDAVVEVLRAGILSSRRGKKTKEFEDEFAKYIGVNHAIAVSSGTAAIHLALAALGIGTGDEVLVPAYTFTSSATPIIMQNAIPVFVDVDPLTYNVSIEDASRKVTENTKAIIVVHLFGLSADMDKVMKFANEYDLYVIEDCAQAHGAKYKGKRVGSIGDVGTFSFYEGKNMMTGEGGMLTTNDDELAERIRMLRDHCEIRGLLEYMKRPKRKWPLTNMLGFNYRMTELQAAIGLVQLTKLDKNNEKRRELAKILNSRLGKIIGIKPPYVPEYAYHIYHVYCSRYFEEQVGVPRELFVKAVNAEGGLVSEGYTIPLYANPIYREKIAKAKGCPFTCPFYKGLVNYSDGICPVTEELCYKRGLWFGIHSELSKEDIEDCLVAVEKVIENIGELKRNYKFS